ncbi:MAG: Uma2 family endonuclease [Saprospiraceae bacterium]
MSSLPILNLFSTIQQVDFSKLLAARNYLVIAGQIIFEKDGNIVMTTIDEDRTDFTVDDYMALPKNAPYELLNGKLHYMPSPFRKHQIVSMNLSAALHFHVKKNKLGQVLAAPMDVHFGKKNIVQPDIIFVSKNRKSILKKFVEGAPDFLVEILSYGTKDKDFGEKKALYGKKGVLEYWVIDPDTETVEVFKAHKKTLVTHKKYNQKDTVKSLTIQDFKIAVSDIFEE